MANSFQNEQEKPELATIAELAENLVYRLPGCADVMIRKALQDVYREFCRETQCLTAERFFTIEDGVVNYVVKPLYGGLVQDVRQVFLDDKLLQLGRDYNVHLGITPIVMINSIYCQSKGPIPVGEEHIYNGTKQLRVIAVETPRIGEESAPVWFIQKHGDALVSGVLARLYAMQGRAFSDPQQASDERIRYENAKSECRMFKEFPSNGQVMDMSMVL